VLGDIRDTFGNLTEMPSAVMADALVEIEGHPWAEMGKARKPLTQNRLARTLKSLGIAPSKIGPEDKRLNGYKRASFEEVFLRYLPPEGVSQPDIQTQCDEMGTSEISQPDSPDSGCPVAEREKPNNDGQMSGCPVAKGGSSENARSLHLMTIPSFLPFSTAGPSARILLRSDRRATGWTISNDAAPFENTIQRPLLLAGGLQKRTA